MGEFICQKCRKVVDNTTKVVCPYCSGRILMKKSSNQVKELQAE